MQLEQLILGTTFTGMGIATMLFPDLVLQYGIKKDELFRANPLSKVIIVCFGSQATLCGLLLLSATLTKRTYRNFGLAMIPYFIFDYVAWQKGWCTALGAIGDGIGNIIFSVCCYIGYNREN